jgi:uncharacterized protein affecting Mg2+/Co2+ transport
MRRPTGVAVRMWSPISSRSSRAPAQNRWFWSYHIRIENHRDDPVQLLTRHWKITDGHGGVNHVDGDGVVGEQPLLKPGGSHDYVSGCPLADAFGDHGGALPLHPRRWLDLPGRNPAFQAGRACDRAMKRTHLPLNGLRVFDAAARHLSFTKAADELAVTPAAVGQQIRALEDMLGVVLFRRTPKGLELTPEADKGLDALRAGFLAVRGIGAGDAVRVRRRTR